MKIKLYLAAASLLLASGMVLAQNNQPSNTNRTAPADRHFVVEAHGKANQELMKLASSKGITLPAIAKAAGTMTTEPINLKGKHREAMDRLNKLSAAEFDREYMRHQIMDHDKDIAMFEREANSGTDAEIKAWAAKTLPTLREHAQMARDIGAKVGVDTKTTTSNLPRPKN